MSDIRALIQRGDQLFEKKGSLLTLWQEIADNFYPERADFINQRSLGTEFAANLTTSYPIIVRRELGNSFGAMLRPRDKEWFEVSIEDEESLDSAGKQWLEWAGGIQRRMMYDRLSQFVRATNQGDHDFASFGQCVLSREMNWQSNTLLYRCWHLRDVAWCERFDGTIGEVHRKWNPTASVLAQLFPKTIDEKVRRIAQESPYRELKCRHVVLRTDDYGERIDGKRIKEPFVSIYIDEEHGKVLEEVGSWSPIYIIPRWQTVSGSQYAFSPAAVAGLPDGRLLQAMTLTLLEAGEMSVRPPMIATQQAIRGDVQLFAGGITWADAAYDERLGEVLRPLTQDKSGIPFGLELNRDTREMLSSAFYLNKLTLPPADREMTAYETGQRVQEYIRSALPLFEPMEIEYNGALCEDTFDGLMRIGAFGRPDEIPESLRGQQVRFKFKSPLHDAIDRQKGNTFIESKQLIREAMELDPSAVASINVRVALRDALGGMGVPAKWQRSEEEVEAAAAQMAAQQQAAEMAALAQEGGKAAEQMGKAQAAA